MKIKNIEQLNHESNTAARSRTSSGLKVKTHIKAGPGPGITDIRPE